MPRAQRRHALLSRADANFEATCLNASFAKQEGERSHCTTMGSTLRNYAAFHKRVFDPATPCEERRVLIIRESFSDIVGVGHAHMGLQRFLALGIALGRAVVFSHCTSPEDRWQVTGRALFKNAQPYECDDPHLSMGDHYVGFGGIDIRWSVERQRLLKSCGFQEVALDLNEKDLPQAHNVFNQPHMAFGQCRKGWHGCDHGWNHDQMGCDVRAKAGCPDLRKIFGPPDMCPCASKFSIPDMCKCSGSSNISSSMARGGGGGAATRRGGMLAKQRGIAAKQHGRYDLEDAGRRLEGQFELPSASKKLSSSALTKPRPRVRTVSKGGGANKKKGGKPLPTLPPYLQRPVRTNFVGYLQANVIGLYNPRRDAGAYFLPAFQMMVANGAATVGAPNGSTVGIASEADLRDTLSCPYSCWAHANFQPASLLRKLIERASKKLDPHAPLTCAHLRTMWVDDHRCAPNPRGCQPVEFRRLVYWNTSGSIQHGTGERTLPTGGARSALDGNPGHFSETLGISSPLWWRAEFQSPLPICRLLIKTKGTSKALLHGLAFTRRAQRKMVNVELKGSKGKHLHRRRRLHPRWSISR